MKFLKLGLAALALVAHAAFAAPQTERPVVEYKISVDQHLGKHNEHRYATTVQVALTHDVTVKSLNRTTMVSEINSTFGDVSAVTEEMVSGISVTVAPLSLDAGGRYTTKISYQVSTVDGSPERKGSHLVKLSPGEPVTLPGFPDVDVTVAIAKVSGLTPR